MSDIVAKAKEGNDVFFFSLKNCPWCAKLATELTNDDIPYRQLTVPDDLKGQIAKETGMKTFPMLFFGKELIGGYTEYTRLQLTNGVQKKLNSNGIKIQYNNPF